MSRRGRGARRDGGAPLRRLDRGRVNADADTNAAANGHTVYVDIETGGLETRRPIIQVAAVAVDRALNEVEEFEVKIRFDEADACPDALRRNHYRRAEWQRCAVAAPRAARSFAQFLRRHASVRMYGRDWSEFHVAQLASHNSQFDGPFLIAWFERLGVFMPASYRVFCTLQRAYWHFHENPDLSLPDDFRLATLCQYFGVPLNPADAHEALADVRATVALYRAMQTAPTSSRATVMNAESSCG